MSLEKFTDTPPCKKFIGILAEKFCVVGAFSKPTHCERWAADRHIASPEPMTPGL